MTEGTSSFPFNHHYLGIPQPSATPFAGCFYRIQRLYCISLPSLSFSRPLSSPLFMSTAVPPMAGLFAPTPPDMLSNLIVPPPDPGTVPVTASIPSLSHPISLSRSVEVSDFANCEDG